MAPASLLSGLSPEELKRQLFQRIGGQARPADFFAAPGGGLRPAAGESMVEP